MSAILLTHSGRKNHIIPVVLDELAAEGIVGIPSTIGRLDLREQWTELARTRVATADLSNSIRNRCVLPTLEKLNEQFSNL